MAPHQISISTDGTHSDLTVSICNRVLGPGFDFVLKGNHLNVESHSKGDHDASEIDWYESLDEREKIDIMNKILAKYREPSLHRDKWKVSAIGITENPDMDVNALKRHLAFVGVNTDMRSEQLDKDCAEQNMLSNMVNIISQYQNNKRANRLEKPPVPKEIHLMGGRDADPNDPEDKGERIIAPCGKCTDTLALWMDPASVVYIYPKNNGNIPLIINNTAETLENVKAGEVWKTTLGHLNRYRHVALDVPQSQAQTAALHALAETLLSPLPEVCDAVVAREVQNKRQHIRSIAELDVATHDGVADPVAVNHYMYTQLVAILRARMKSENIPADINSVLGWLQSERVGTISLAVVQHEDGSFAAGAKVQSKSKADRASSSSQLSSINSLDSVVVRGEHPVSRAWSMNFSMEDIASGQTTTPSKDGVERLIKAMNGKAIAKPFTHFVLNDGGLDAAALSKITLNFSQKELSPGGFKGAHTRINGTRHESCHAH